MKESKIVKYGRFECWLLGVRVRVLSKNSMKTDGNCVCVDT